MLQGNGDGTFQARQTFATTAGNRLINLAAADFNGDGKPDIVAFNNIGTSNLLVNTTTGNYTGPVFQVVNAVQTAINIGTIPDIQYGTSTQVVSGQLVTSIPIPIGESVNVAIDGVAHSALVDSHGNFTLSFASSTLATGQHTVEVDFAGDTQLLASTATSSFHVTQATPAIVVVDQGGTYTGNPFPANATVTGVGGATVSGTVTYTYFGPTVLGNTAPTNVGNYSVVATFTSSDPNYNGVQSQPVAFSIVPGAPSKLAFVPLLPSRLTAGNSTGVISVQVQDKFGNLVTTDSSTSLSLKINGVVIGTTTDQGGVATFAGATLNLAGQVSIVVSASGLLAASTSITVLPSSPNHLVFTTPPATSIVAGKPLSDFKVAVEDTFGNIVTTDANPIALSITALTGNASTTSFTSSYANGVTTFSNLTFNTTGAYTVGAIDSLETSVTGVVSSRITVAAAPATTMTVLHGLPTVPVTAGVAIAQPVQIALYDQFGNLATNDTSMVALNVISGGHFSSGQTSVSVRAVGGIATFNNLTFNQVGTYSLSATDTEASLVNGNGTISVGSIHVVATTASKLVLSAPLPSTLTAGGFTGAFAVQIQDRFGNLETTDNSTVLTLNVIGVSVGTSKASGGIASFSGVQLTAARTTTIQVTATGLTSTSASIVVTPGTPTHLAVTSQPSSTVVAGNTIASVKVAVEDAYNNIVTADSSSINLAISGGSASFANPPMISYASGVTTFSNLVINQAGAFKLVASDTSEPSVTGATSNTVTVTPAPATTMTVLRGLPTANVTAGVAIAPSVQIAVHDRFGNLVTNDSSIVTLTITSGGHFSTGLTSLSVRLSGGIADFRSMVFNLAGTYTLTATDTEASLINGNGTINVGSVQVVAAAASKLVFTPALPTTLSAGSSTGTITVSEVDRFGNVVASDNSTTLTLKINGVVIGTATVSNGLAKFSGALLTKLGANSVVVSATGRTSASATITVQ